MAERDRASRSVPAPVPTVFLPCPHTVPFLSLLPLGRAQGFSQEEEAETGDNELCPCLSSGAPFSWDISCWELVSGVRMVSGPGLSLV